MILLVALPAALGAEHGATWSTRRGGLLVTLRVWQTTPPAGPDPVEASLDIVTATLTRGARGPTGTRPVRTVVEVVVPTATTDPQVVAPVAVDAISAYADELTAAGSVPPGAPHPVARVLVQPLGPGAPDRPVSAGVVDLPA